MDHLDDGVHVAGGDADAAGGGASAGALDGGGVGAASGQDLEALYQSPDERDFRRDYDEGLPSSGTCPPEGLVYLTEVLGYYLAQRPADGLLAAPSPEEPLGRVLARVPPGDTPVTGKPVHD